MSPKYVNFHFDKTGEISSELENRAKDFFVRAGAILEKEWSVEAPLPIAVSILENASFRGGRTTGPKSWKYCFLLRDQRDGKIYCNVDIFNVLPDDAEKMIKHETAHFVVSGLVGDYDAYKRSYFLEEGTAGLDGATERLIAKMKKENVMKIRDPLSIKTMDDIAGDTNKEPFIDQLGYLTQFSAVEFLRKQNGERKIIEVYKNLKGGASLEETYKQICWEELAVALSEWRAGIENRLYTQKQ
jgi:hypothetical protein